MQIRRILIMIALLVILVCSIAAKLLNSGAKLEADIDKDIAVLTKFMKDSQFIKINSSEINVEGTFITHSYKAKRCDGYLNITFLYRNAEGEHLFNDKVRFIYQGSKYQKFPNSIFWINNKIDNLNSIFIDNNSKKKLGKNTILAVREIGGCSLIELIKWGNLMGAGHMASLLRHLN